MSTCRGNHAHKPREPFPPAAPKENPPSRSVIPSKATQSRSRIHHGDTEGTELYPRRRTAGASPANNAAGTAAVQIEFSPCPACLRGEHDSGGIPAMIGQTPPGDTDGRPARNHRKRHHDADPEPAGAAPRAVAGDDIRPQGRSRAAVD